MGVRVTPSTTNMTAALVLLVMSSSGQLIISADLGFFGNIHSEGYPTFDWLATDFADFGPEESPRLPLVKQRNKETEIGKFSNPGKIVKRHHVKKAENEIFNPSKYYYPNTNINPEKNNILEPVLKKEYEERREDIYIPVYHEDSSKQENISL